MTTSTKEALTDALVFVVGLVFALAMFGAGACASTQHDCSAVEG